MNITIPKINEKTLSLPSAKAILKGVLVVILARARLGGMSPLGLAFAATFAPADAYLGVLGLFAGMADNGADACAKYVISYLIYYILSRTKKSKSAMLSASLIIGGGISLLWTGASYAAALLLLSEAVLCGGAHIVLSTARNEDFSGRVSELIIIGGVLCGISGAQIPYINVNASLFAAVFIAMSICYATKPAVAVFACAILGFVMSASGADAIFLCGSFAISAALASLLAEMGKLALSVGFLCGVTVSALYKGSLSGMNIFDVLTAIGFFAVLPNRVHYRIGSFINRRFDAEEEPSANEQVAVKLKTVASALSRLSRGFSGITESDEGAKTVINTVSARVCRDCSLYESCWADGKKTQGNMLGIWQAMETDGFCDAENMPARLRQSCIRCERLLCEFRHAYEMAKQSALLSGEAGADRTVMARQYGEISGVLELLSREIETGNDEELQGDARFSVRVTVVNEAKPGDVICGDTLVHFRRGNSYFVVLCDGMGSGDAARTQSRLAAKLFEEFLKAGFAKNTAVNLINSALALKPDRESFSTADILEIDLENGTAEFLKIGSAQSLIKSKNEISVISSKALPIGILEQVEAKPEQRAINVGDVILMISDGIGEAGAGIMKNEWIKKLMLLENRKDDELARMILDGAKSRTRYCDDMTCCIVRIKK